MQISNPFVDLAPLLSPVVHPLSSPIRIVLNELFPIVGALAQRVEVLEEALDVDPPELTLLDVAQALGHSEHQHGNNPGATYLVGLAHLTHIASPGNPEIIGVRCECGWERWIGRREFDMLTMRDLNASQGHICLHDVLYGGESNLSMDLTPQQSCEVAAAILGIDVDELISLVSRKSSGTRSRPSANALG